MTLRSSSLAALAALVVGCTPDPLPPMGHVEIAFDTDAPLPTALGELPPEGEPAPLFDRLLVEVIAPNATTPCTGCRREIALDRRLFTTGRASIQVPARPGDKGYRVRVRLFLAAHLVFGTEPPPSGTIEVVSELLPSPEEGGVVQTIFLATDDVGRPKGTLTAPLPPAPGRSTPSKVGTWSGATPVPCEAALADGEACVPGGAFWMGRPGERAANDIIRNDRPRLVVVGPTIFDTDEVSVARFRTSNDATVLAIPWSGSSSGADFKDFCTFTLTGTPAKNEALPVNCLTWTTARQFCLSKGKDLPTEAEFERAAGAMESRRFVWGDDPPRCADAVWGRGGEGYLLDLLAPCRTGVYGPACVGPSCAHGRDALEIGGIAVRDLAGNLSEWTVDSFQGQDEPCWNQGGVLRDPVCRSEANPHRVQVVRGGSWVDTGTRLAASAREGQPIYFSPPEIGFRCARPGAPRACTPAVPGVYFGPISGDDTGSVTLGIGCNGVVSASGNVRSSSTSFFNMSGAIDAAGHLRFEGRQILESMVDYRFVGEVVDAKTIGGTWTSGDGKKGTWRSGRP